ncbi:Uncharacterised protein [Mycobacterium tuberculosis]|nr:Uncharacterised protein [Mycobacterium tuberculosis]
MDAFCAIAALGQCLGQLIYSALGSAKDNSQFWRVDIQQAAQYIKLLLLCHFHILLLNIRYGHFFCLYRDHGWIIHELLSNFLDRARHGR